MTGVQTCALPICVEISFWNRLGDGNEMKAVQVRPVAASRDQVGIGFTNYILLMNQIFIPISAKPIKILIGLGLIGIFLILRLLSYPRPDKGGEVVGHVQENAYPQPVLDTQRLDGKVTPPVPEIEVNSIVQDVSFPISPRREAGNGIIFEDSFSPFSAAYVIENCWMGFLNGRKTLVYAGAQRNDPEMGGKRLDEPWPGLLVVWKLDTTDEPEQGMRFWTPSRAGAIRIISAEKNVLLLSSSQGMLFGFDLETLQFLSEKETPSSIVRKAGNGEIVERGRTQLDDSLTTLLEGYNIHNYWRGISGNNQLVIFAGEEKNQPEKGKLILTSFRGDQGRTASDFQAIEIPLCGAPVRIFNAQENYLTLANNGGESINFDLTTYRFFPSSGQDILIGDVLTDATVVEPTPTLIPTPNRPYP